MVGRRAVLAGAVGGAGLLAAARVVAMPADRAVGPDTPSGGVSRLVATGSPLLASDPDAHLVRRLAPAPSTDLLEEVRDVGPASWLDGQLAPSTDPGPARLRTLLAELAVETMSVPAFVAAHRAARDAREARPADRAGARDAPELLPPAVELGASLLLRRVVGDQQLLESMVELWSDVLHVHIGHDPGTQLFAPFLVRDVLRPHALGRFDDLLVAVTTSPAMLQYLDGRRSRAGAVNENHARELLELHSVGVDAHDEHDVAATAQVLTGWVVDPSSGTARLLPRRHDDTVVEVLTWQGAGASADSEDLLRYLAHHPATAGRIAHALAVRFVADDPSPDLVDDLAEVYLASDTAIAPVLRALVDHSDFAAAAGAKLRRPAAFVTAALAGVAPGLPIGTGDGVLRVVGAGLRALGHTPLGWPAPDGYPDTAGAWVSSAAALGRWTLATELAALVDAAWLSDATTVIDELPRRLLLAAPDAAVRDALLQAASRAADPVAAATALVLDLPAAHLR